MTNFNQILADIRSALATTYFADRLDSLGCKMTIDANRNMISVFLISATDATFELIAVHHGEDRWGIQSRVINPELRVSTSMRMLERDIAREIAAAFGSNPIKGILPL